MEAALKAKLTKVVELVDKNLADPDIELDYFIPGVTMDEETALDASEPYILLTYIINEDHTQKQRIPIKDNYLSKTPEDIANLVTFFIEQFTEQIDSVENGAQ
ncbi:MAG: Unknown protein [uncultured Sulfurovum sp.]|uniref:Uncharacterized protein n=1 Tax=uncultured Sulfurovum sp. TaxID=269237 RepID=A0A6S6SJ30_9BACT|nr:MAG: Unknown protein [uncultured Sulfurovum sp.]